MGSVGETIPGIGELEQLVRRNENFDPVRRADFGSDDYYFWNRIGSDTSVYDLITGSGLPARTGTDVIKRLLAWGAILLETEDVIDIDIDDQSELGQVTHAEATLLSEQVDLAVWERRRIIYMLRIVRRRSPLELLGVGATASKRTIKRAYFDLSKEFHPDRHFGKNLGSYGPLLSLIFQAATQAMRTLSSRNVGPSTSSRRSSERYPLAVAASVTCESWPIPQNLVTSNISEGGMYFATEARTRAGARIQVSIQLPTLGSITLRGRVAGCRAASETEHCGIGVELVRIDKLDQARYDQLLLAARTLAPVPSDTWTPPDDDAGTPLRPHQFARGSASVRRPCTIIGIDLGTTFTSVSAAVGNQVRVLPWPGGGRSIPSVVGFPQTGSCVVGNGARKRLLTDPRHTVSSAKRLLGRRANERDLELHLSQVAYDHETGTDGSVVIDMWGEKYAIPQLCAYLLRAAKNVAEHSLGHEIDKAVLTVPVSFDRRRLDLLVRSAHLAHLEVVGIVDEPSAAAIANRYRPDFGGVVGLYDFGGGTFDFSVVDASAGDFRVLTTGGDSWLGGDDFDYAMAEATANEFWKRHGIDLRARAVEWQQLLFACERAKRRLTEHEVASIIVPDALHVGSTYEDLRVRVSRGAAERLWAPVIERSLGACADALTRIGMAPTELDAIYLSGGMSYVPVVRRALRERFEIPVRIGVPPEYAACLGAGIHAAQLDVRGSTALPSRM